MKGFREEMVESLVSSGTRLAPYRNLALLSLKEDVAEILRTDARSKGTGNMLNYGEDESPHRVCRQPLGTVVFSIVHGNH